MRNRTALAALFTLTIGLSACGKYGPPERTVPRGSPPPPATAEPVTQVPEEEIPGPTEFDDTAADEESDR